jgi:hypothetical protein
MKPPTCCKAFLLLLPTCLLVDSSLAWSTSKPQTRSLSLSSTEPVSTRRVFAQTLVSVATSLPLASSAATLDLPSQIALNAALRNLKSSQKQLASLEATLEFKEYTKIKDAFRSPPLSELRKSCGTLFKVVDKEESDLGRAYRELVSALESLDSTASLILRGRDITPDVVRSKYTATLEAMDKLVREAEAVVNKSV